MRDLDAGDELPVGTVTFLLTDVVGSSRLWDRDPESARRALMAHRRLIDMTVTRRGGARPQEQGEGDSTLSAFADASNACAAALEIEDRLGADPDTAFLQLRMALFTGEAQLMDGRNYLAAPVNRCARLRALAHPGQILLSRSTFAAARDLPPGVELKDLGMHRLKDLAQAEHVFQLSRPGHGSFPPLSSLDSFTNNLPVQLTTFVGRDEVGELISCVAAHRLVTLSGSGGCGKTRLALEAAADLVGRYPDGAWFVDFSAVSDPGQVAPEVAGALLLQPGALQSSLDALRAFLKDRTLLLVWDNCEHVVQACAQLADVLLRECSGVTLFATSREPLGVPGEVIWQVASLPTGPADGSDDDVENLLQYGAIRLFVERAVEARPDFRLDPACAPTVVAICRRLDGIPLAIELAAARVRILTPAEILEAIQDSFQLLTRGARTALARHQTIATSIDWSYSSLSEAEQLVFERLSPFWSFTLEEAQEVCGFAPLDPSEVLDLIASLIDKSLVQVEVVDTHTRYRMLATIRAFAARRLFHRGETATMLLRHTSNFLELLHQSREHLEEGDVAWIDRFDDEFDNLRSAVQWSLTSDAAAVLRCALPLAILSGHTGRAEETLSWLDAALANAQVDPELRATALYAKAVMAAYRLDVLSVLPVALEAQALFCDLGHEQGLGRSGILVGFGQTFLGEAETGMALIKQGIETARRLDDRYSLRVGLLIGGYWLTHQDVELGRRSFAECLQMHPSEGTADLALAITFLSWCDLRQGRWLEALKKATRARDLARKQHQRQTLALSLIHMGEALVGLGRIAEAGPLVSEGERICLEMQDLGVYAAMLSLRCRMLYAQGDLVAAREAGTASVGLFAGTAPQFNCLPQLRLAKVELAAGDHQAGLASLGEAASVAEAYSLSWPMATAVYLGAWALLRQDRPEEATAGALDALTRFMQVQDDSGVVESLELLAAIAVAVHRDRDAVRLLAAAHVRRERTGCAVLPVDQADHDRQLEILHERLLEDFDQEWDVGAVLSAADLVSLGQALNGRQPRVSVGDERGRPLVPTTGAEGG